MGSRVGRFRYGSPNSEGGFHMSHQSKRYLFAAACVMVCALLVSDSGRPAYATGTCGDCNGENMVHNLTFTCHYDVLGYHFNCCLEYNEVDYSYFSPLFEAKCDNTDQNKECKEDKTATAPRTKYTGITNGCKADCTGSCTWGTVGDGFLNRSNQCNTTVNPYFGSSHASCTEDCTH